MEHRLNGHHRRTLQQIFSHPLPHNIERPDILSLMGELGTVVDRHNGVVLFEVGTMSDTFRPPQEKYLSSDDVVRLRKMLTSAGGYLAERLERAHGELHANKVTVIRTDRSALSDGEVAPLVEKHLAAETADSHV